MQPEEVEAMFDDAKERGRRDAVYLPNFMCEQYSAGTPAVKSLFREVISTWVPSSDLDRRYVAMWMIRELSLISLAPTLQAFAEGKGHEHPMDKFDKQKAYKLVDFLNTLSN